MSSSRHKLLMLLPVVLAIAACKPHAPTPAKAAPVPAAATAPQQASVPAAVMDEVQPATTTPQDLGEFHVVSVLLGNSLAADKAVASDKSVFSGRDAIYASVLSTGANQGLRLSAKWLAPDGSTIAESEQPLVPTTATAITFSIRRPEPWPLGDYQVLIGINGRNLEIRNFQVR